MKSFECTLEIIINFILITLCFCAAISITYLWVIPTFMHGYKTYAFLIVGIFGAFIFVTRSTMKTRINHIKRDGIAPDLLPYLLELGLSFLIGSVAAVLVGFLSLFILVTLLGS